MTLISYPVERLCNAGIVIMDNNNKVVEHLDIPTVKYASHYSELKYQD